MKYLILIVLSFSLFGLERLDITREDQSTLVGYLDLPEEKQFPLIIIVPGSQKESSLRMFESLQKDLKKLKVAIVTLEKRGIENPEQIDEKVYHNFLSLLERREDHLLIIEKIQEELKGRWNGKMAIIGQGDGGRVAASFAKQIKNVSSLVLISSGGAWPAQTETLQSFRLKLVKSGFNPQYIHSFLVQAKNELNHAIKKPDSNLQAFGYSYKYWASLLSMNFMSDLKELKCPIYIVHGELDDRIPIESVEQLSKQLETVTFRKKNGAGREIMQELSTYKEAIGWLSTQL